MDNRGILAQLLMQQEQPAPVGGILNSLANQPVTANRNMLAQALRARSKPPMNQLKDFTFQEGLDAAAMATSPVPILGDLVGLGSDAYRFATDPGSRNMMNYGLAALGVLPFVPAMSAGLGRLAQSRGVDITPPSMSGPGRNQAGAVVYHGSPHKFDQFDASKIGTGEGAQAYGHGLYLAESPDVAKQYREGLAPIAASKDSTYQRIAKRGDALANRLSDRYGVSDLETFREIVQSGEVSGVPQKYINALNQYDSKLNNSFSDALKNNSYLYKVDLPDEAIAKMLDWDKPLSQQSKEVKAALIKSGMAKNPDAIHENAGDWLKTSGGAGREASSDFSSFGIPGIRYLDGGSRGAGQGTSNYVVFPGNENMLRILSRE